MRYRVHRLDIKMTSAQTTLAQFLETLDGEVVAIIPNVATVLWFTYVNFLLIVERIDRSESNASGRSAA